MTRRIGIALMLSLCAACESSASLFVDLKTDYDPDDVDRVRVELLTSPPAETAGGDIQLFDVRASTPLLEGARVAEYATVAPGEYWVRVSLLSSRGDVIARRPIRARIDAPTTITAILARGCDTIVCPPGGSPDLVACNGGECVDPTCSPEDPTRCGEGECERDADCPPRGECARVLCEGRACLYGADPARCDAGELCAWSTLSCEPIAAPLDGGSCAARETACTDGIDEDCDASTDCADPDCAGVACDDGDPCTHSDACAGTCTGVAISCVSDACNDRACNGTAACTTTVRGLAPCADDGNPCTADVCDGSGACVHPPHAEGTACSGGRCCGGGCVDLATNPFHCGACGIACGSGSCDAGSCTCFSNAECRDAGYGAMATCYTSRCQCVCNPDAAWRGTCGGECAGGALCDQSDFLNHCFYP